MGVLKDLKWQLKRLNLRTKVIVMFLVIMGIFVYRISFSTHYYIVELQGQDKVNEIIKFAHEYLYNHIENFSLKTDGLARLIKHNGTTAETFEAISSEVKRWDRPLRPDMLFYIDKEGKIVFSGNRIYNDRDNAALRSRFMSLQAVQKALKGQSVDGFNIIPPEIIRAEGLLDTARIPIVPTPNSREIDYSIEERALAFFSAKPVYVNGEVSGALITGRMLNNRFDIVDRLNSEFNISATIFMDNIRISTTVPDKNDNRALGTVLSIPVENQVLVNGEKYLGRAFVVNDWYVTAYEPVRDINNRVIGALYVGLKEAPLLKMQEDMDNEIKFTLGILTLVFVLALYWLYRSIVIPLQRMSSSAIRFARGELEVQIPTGNPNTCWQIKQCGFFECPVYNKSHLKCWLVPKTKCCDSGKDACSYCKIYRQHAGNEIESLADAFNYMAASIQEYTRSLYDLNIELEEKNLELTDQKDELECQKEQLMALNQELEASMKALDDSQSIIYALAVAVEAKDPYTRGHSERVADFSVNLASTMGMSEYDFETIRGAALLHDIGKIGISGSILRKPASLTAIEFQQVKKHPGIGERICSSLKFARDMLPIIRHHHERFDGKGYPDGLKGEKIPLMARIVAIADAFDAMTSDRPYRPGMTTDEALGVLKKGAGTQWDPELVTIFTDMVKESQTESLVALSLEEGDNGP